MATAGSAGVHASRPHELKSRISRGEAVHGIMMGDLASAPLVHLAAAHGLDFIVLDAEHSAFSEERLAQLAELAVLRGIAPIVRVPPTVASVQKVIHLGAVGVMLPGVLDVTEARSLVDAAYLPPQGTRGYSTHSMPVRLGTPRWRPADLKRSDAVAAQNSWVTVILQIETAALLGRLAETAAIPGVDVLLLGATDLSVSLGIPDMPPTDQRIAAALAFDGGPPPAKGASATAAVPAHEWRRRGATFLIVGHDTDLFEHGLRAAVDQLAETRP
jgi:2-keto-3-deoxy-L-rhamnonate aldolase RhmA